MSPFRPSASVVRLALALFGVMGGMGAGTAHAALPAGAAAQIVDLQGQGEQRSAQRTDWQAAHIQQTLAGGDFVRTREAARMALLLADQTQLRLHHNSILQIKALAQSAQESTRLHLEQGRVWMQTRRSPGSALELQTPAATAAIRGTDWDMRVEPSGRTLLTVLSGTVELSNAQGAVQVQANEAAVVEVGQAPVKLHLTAPRERVQWVNALAADPVAPLQAAPPPDGLLPVVQALAQRKPRLAHERLGALGSGVPEAWRSTLEAAIALQAGQWEAARRALEANMAHADSPLAAWLMRADMQLVDGEGAAANQTLDAALQRWGRHPALLAQRARAALLADHLPQAHETLQSAGSDASIELTLVRAALARREGDAPTTLAAYQEATQTAPEDARGWLGLGSAQAEREDSTPARKNLQQALSLDPKIPGGQGEVGTLETLANDFERAQAAFDAALQDNPADYVALTGLGLLRLKQGAPEAALDAFLRAGVMEPRYARAKTWTAVAYYQLGRHQDAIVTLEQAAALDDKDPLPYVLLAQIHTDLFQPGEAVSAARAGVLRMPYLKSLNQIANDQKGSANLGAALAFFGMEDWAMELAQQSFNPYWGASHLFLADRYSSEFNKNSALFRGFLTDPLAFGASARFASLLQRPGRHGSVDGIYSEQDSSFDTVAITVNGMDNRHIPMAWYVKAQTLKARDIGIPVNVYNYPAFSAGDASVNVRALIFGFGMEPTERLKVFAYANTLNIDGRGNNEPPTTLSKNEPRAVLGMSYQWHPQAQTSLQMGYGSDTTPTSNYPSVIFLTPPSAPPIRMILGWGGESRKQLHTMQLRHTEDRSADTRWSITAEHVREAQTNLANGLGIVQSATPNGIPVSTDISYQNFTQIRRRYSALTLGLRHRYRPGLTVDGALGWQHIDERVQGFEESTTVTIPSHTVTPKAAQGSERSLTPRLGLVLQPAPGHSLRLAYQDWLRPLSASTLADIETAGIPVDSELLQAGGRYKRSALQWGYEWGGSTYLGLRAEHLRLRNPVSIGVDARTPDLPLVQDLHLAQVGNVSGGALLEAVPDYQQGRLQRLGLSVNHMFSRQWSGYAQWIYQDSHSDFDGNGQRVQGLKIPYIPRQTAMLGATWVSGKRWYLSGRLVYRSARFVDAGNTAALDPGWSLDVAGFWESEDKHWTVGAAAANLFAPQTLARYTVLVRYRF